MTTENDCSFLSFRLIELKHAAACTGTHRISTVPRCHHYLTALQQQEVAAALPSTVDFLNEGGQVLKALPPPLLKEEKLREREETHQNTPGMQQTCCIQNKQVQLRGAETVLMGFHLSKPAGSSPFGCKIISALPEGFHSAKEHLTGVSQI